MHKAAEIIRNRKADIMLLWKDEVRGVIEGADYVNDLVLLDHLPELLDDIVNILNTFKDYDFDEETADFRKLIKNSNGHGRHRSSSLGYSIEQIIREYIIFHKVITDVLIEEKAYGMHVSMILKYSIENAILYSVSAFNSSLDEMRQKLVRILVHDLRNPISAAYLAVDMMKREDTEERFNKMRKMIKSSLKRASDLIEGLLESISIEAGEGMTINFSNIDLMEHIQAFHYEARQMYSSEIKLEIKGQDEIQGIFDGAMIRRVLENLLNNAIKYGNEDEPVEIFVENQPELVKIAIHNYGDPIPDEKKEIIFRFLETSGKDQTGNLRSWGIGLAVVKAIIEAHGGEILLESSRERGTFFTVILYKQKNKPGKIKVALKMT